MNKKGVTLVSVVVIIIVMIIIATTSIISGNKLILNAKNLTDNQKIESIKEAIGRKKTEINLQGTIMPKGESYPGTVDPLIGDGSYRAKGWYTLDQPDLLELGVKDLEGRFLVNYEYGEVYDMTKAEYLENYFVSSFIHKIVKNVNDDFSGSLKYLGEKLRDIKYSGDTGYRMYQEKSDDEDIFYGTGWYIVSANTVIDNLSGDVLPGSKLKDLIKSDDSFLVNYEDNKFKKVTNKFSELKSN